jgi:hypothetical protein
MDEGNPGGCGEGAPWFPPHLKVSRPSGQPCEAGGRNFRWWEDQLAMLKQIGYLPESVHAA